MKTLNYFRKMKGLSFRLFLSFILLLSLFFVKQFSVQRQLTQEENTSETINIAGRQGMLSQKISKDLSLLHYEGSKEVQEIEESLSLFVEVQEDLLAKGKNDRVIVRRDKDTDLLYQEVAKDYEKFIKTSNEYLKKYQNTNSDRDELSILLQRTVKNGEEFLKDMDQVVFQYEDEANEALANIRIFNLHLFVLILLLFLYAFFRVVLPMMNVVRASFEDMRSLKRDLTKILEQMKDVLFLVDIDGEILFMNEKALALFEQKELSENKEHYIQDLLWLNFDMEAYLARAKMSGKEEEIEVLFESASKEVIPFSMSSLVEDYGGQEAIVLTLQDISKQKEAEAILKRIARRDELTGLYNRYVLESILEKEFTLADNYDLPIAIAILDLDYFKKVNDQYGHPVGDIVLKESAELVMENISASDYAVRIGGEEFLIFMPNTTLEEAEKRMECIRQKLEAFSHPKVGVVTVSIGLVERQIEEDYLSVYDRVDDALYQAKENGRNQLCVRD